MGIGFKGMDFKVTRENSAWGRRRIGKTVGGCTSLSLGELNRFYGLVEGQASFVGGKISWERKVWLDSGMISNRRCVIVWVYHSSGVLACLLGNVFVGYYTKDGESETKLLYPYVCGHHENLTIPAPENDQVKAKLSMLTCIRPLGSGDVPQSIAIEADKLTHAINGQIQEVYHKLGTSGSRADNRQAQ